jgi:hypothetical protein
MGSSAGPESLTASTADAGRKEKADTARDNASGAAIDWELNMRNLLDKALRAAADAARPG